MNRVLLDFEKRAEIGNIDLPVSLWFALNRRYYRLFDILVEKYQDPNGCDIKGRTAMVSVLFCLFYVYLYIFSLNMWYQLSNFSYST
jgi:hypothetical protein